MSVTITHLPPNSELDFQIAVINKRRYGTLTSKLPVVTKEGGKSTCYLYFLGYGFGFTVSILQDRLV